MPPRKRKQQDDGDDTSASEMTESESEDEDCYAYNVATARGAAALDAEDWPAAIAAFGDALRVPGESESADCAYNLACASACAGKVNEAMGWLRKASAWGVTDVDPANDPQLQALLDDPEFAKIARELRKTETIGVPSAAVMRSRRPTQGQRISELVGKAQDEDDTFWNHDTWAEDDDEYSDEGPVVDHFDSDFDHTEDEHSDSDGEGGTGGKGGKKKKARREEADDDEEDRKKRTAKARRYVDR